MANGLTATNTPGPMPDDASIPRLRSGNFDGIHFKSMNGNMTIEDSLIECNGDDGIASNTTYQVIVDTSGSSLFITNMYGYTFSEGEGVYVARWRDMGIAGEAAITSMERVDDASFISSLRQKASYIASNIMPSGSRGAEDLVDNDIFYRVSLSTDIPVEAGDMMATRMRSSGLVIRRNMIRNARARGMMLKASDMIIEDNIVMHKMNAAIAIYPEAWWLESGHFRNVIIRGNLLLDNAFGPLTTERVLDIRSGGFESDSPAGSLASYTIDNNVLASNYDVPMGITAVSELTISGNAIQTHHTSMNCMIQLKNSSNVTVQGNAADDESFDQADNTVCQDNVTDILLDDPMGRQ